MNILNKLTIKHLKMNKKRTLVTIIGIILSTSLMVGIGLLVSTFLTTSRLDAEESFGKYHVAIQDITKDEYDILNKNIKVEKIKYYTGVGFAKIDTENSFKPYVYIAKANSEFLNELKLKDGRIPNAANEIVVGENALKDGSLSYKIGDQITLNVGNRTYEGEVINDNSPIGKTWNGGELEVVGEETIENMKPETYKVVGIIEKTSFEYYDSAGYMLFTKEENTPEHLSAFIELKKPQDTFDNIEELAQAINVDKNKFVPNQSLLFYYGATKYENVNNTLLPLILIALSVISVGCIIVIYNSFAISTMERKKSFGLYSSIGATQKQIKKTVLFEAIIVGSIGITLGIIGGFLGIYVVVKILNMLISESLGMTLLFSVNYLYLVIPLIFMVLVILISAYLPAKRSSKVTPIEAIRGNDDIKIKASEVKTPKIITKIFGIEGELAHKNTKRNKKKYRVTIISLFISIIMFNTFTSFLGYIVKSTNTVDNTDYDVGFDLTSDLETIKKDINVIKQSYNIEEERIMLHRGLIDITNNVENSFTTMWKNIGPGNYDRHELTVQLIVLPDKDMSKITSEEGLILNKKYRTIYEGNTRKTTETTMLKNGTYTLEVDGSSTKIKAVTSDKEYYGLKNALYSQHPVLLISESTYKNKFNPIESSANYVFNTKDYKKIAKDYEDKKINLESSINNMNSPKIENANIKNIVLAIKILFYGFIALVVLIGVTSVINTINTSMNLRRKEFAMLRSVGLTPKGFNKLLFFESLFFGLKSLFYGIPVSIGINALIALAMAGVFETSLIIPWGSMLITVIGVFIIVIIAMKYATKKIKKENILESLREENI